MKEVEWTDGGRGMSEHSKSPPPLPMFPFGPEIKHSPSSKETPGQLGFIR